MLPSSVHCIRSDGRPKFASNLIIISNAINLVMDIVLMGPFKMGIAGSAIATVIGNVIAFCEETGTRLVHISTMSIGGVFLDCPGEVASLKENMLYYGQVQGSKYTDAKFLAEREILEKAASGMNAKIMRVGNLSARESDGEYQINFTANSFIWICRSSFHR